MPKTTTPTHRHRPWRPSLPSYGYASQGYHVFLAKGLHRATAGLEPEEQDLVIGTFASAEVERMIAEGEIKDATTVAAFGLLRLKGLL